MKYRFIARFKAPTGKVAYFEVPETALAFDALIPSHPSASTDHWNNIVAQYPELKLMSPIQVYHSNPVRITGQPGLEDSGKYDALFFKVPVLERQTEVSRVAVPTSSSLERPVSVVLGAVAPSSIPQQFVGSPKSARYFGFAYFLVLLGTCGAASFVLASNRLPETSTPRAKTAAAPHSSRELMLSSESLLRLMYTFKKSQTLSSSNERARLHNNFIRVCEYTAK